MARRKRGVQPLSKKKKRQFELLGGVATVAASALVVSIFLLTSLDKILIASNQYASVIASVLVDLANGDRFRENLHSLSINPSLVAAAEAKAADMASKGYFAHISPEGKDSWYWFKEAGYSFSYAGENLAVDFSDSTDVESAWMGSPTHRANLLDPHFTEIGIATASGYFEGRPTIFVVQMFGAPSNADTAAAILAITPEDPRAPALATSEEEARVLGVSDKAGVESAEGDASESVALTPQEVVEKGAVRSSLETKQVPDYAPGWAHILASPREALRYAYYALALVILLALLIETGFELRLHHRKKAATAGFLFVLMAALFLVADTFILGNATIVKRDAQTASAVAAL